MIVLVTGGAGFIGSHLCQALLNKNHEVICLDNFFTGSKVNLDTLIGNKKFEFMRHDVTIPFAVEADFILNFACPASPVHYSTDPVQTVKTNIFGALNVLELANRLKIPVLQASTSEIYGDPEVSPQAETYVGAVNPTGPRACYDEGKRCAETLCFDFKRQYDLDVRVARIFNTYGPNMLPNDGRVVSNFIVQALTDKKITIYGDGKQTRSFCYVTDMIEALIKFMELKQCPDTPINLGNPTEITIGFLADKIVDLVGSDCELVYKPLPVDDPAQRLPDVTLAREILHWQAHTELDNGLSKTIDYFRQLILK